MRITASEGQGWPYFVQGDSAHEVVYGVAEALHRISVIRCNVKRGECSPDAYWRYVSMDAG